jgi:hypothetical protein
MRTNACLAAAALIAAVASPSARATLVLSDNYTAPNNPNTFDVNFNIAARQAGTLAPATYAATGNTQVGNPTMRTSANDGNYLLLAFGGTVSPQKSVGGANSQGGLNFSFNVAPDNDVNSDEWTAINLGLSQANQLAFVNANVPHFGILFRANGQIQAFDGSTVVSGAQVYGGINRGGTDNNFHFVQLRLTDPNDGNPLDGVGQTTIDVYSDEVVQGLVPIFTYTKTGGGYADGFFNLQAIGIGGVDDLTITNGVVPEPATVLALGAIAGVGAMGRRRRLVR